jgi:hypothetical protein
MQIPLHGKVHGFTAPLNGHTSRKRRIRFRKIIALGEEGEGVSDGEGCGLHVLRAHDAATGGLINKSRLIGL